MVCTTQEHLEHMHVLSSVLQASQNSIHHSMGRTHPDSLCVPQILSPRIVEGLGPSLNSQYTDPTPEYFLQLQPTTVMWFRGLAWDGTTGFETCLKHGFELDLNHSNARLDKLSSELQLLMGSWPILIDFPRGIMMQNPFFFYS